MKLKKQLTVKAAKKKETIQATPPPRGDNLTGRKTALGKGSSSAEPEPKKAAIQKALGLGVLKAMAGPAPRKPSPT
jgi:hypothetical protein